MLIDFITNKYDMTILSNKYIVDEIIKILNKYTFVKEKDILIYILKNELSKKYNVEMPIVDSVYNILFNKLTPEEAVFKLMTREAKQED